jgi:thiamine-monophosphate kinase
VVVLRSPPSVLCLTSPGAWLRYIGSLPLAEKALIARIRRQAARPSRVSTGIGDDCAVLGLPRGHEVLITTDFSLEGVHFRRDWHPAKSVGHRCLARGLSDIAAMGGRPVAAFLSLALPRTVPQSWVDEFVRGLLALARSFDVRLDGGDTAQSPQGILADMVVLGSVPRGTAVLRSNARPDDRIYVSGTLGGSAAALERLQLEPRRKLDPREFPQQFFPQPRVALGRILRQRGLVSAMIDLSDGLSTDVGHLCDESEVGAELRAEAIPLAAIGGTREKVSLRAALHGGEDYELLFTASPDQRLPSRIARIPITEIGRITRAKKVILLAGQHTRRNLKPQGWQHFLR